MKSTLLAAGLLLAGAGIACADVKLPSIFSDHMVLQRDVAAVPVWGKADPGEEVTVTIDGQSKTTKAGADGKWMVKLANLKTGGPHTLTVKGKNSLTVNDVLIGEVWLGSGQSNMAMTVNRANDYEKEQAAAKLPEVRMFIVSSGAADAPQDDCVGRWQVCSPESVGGFSATLFFFGREVHKVLQVPMGLINSSVGGTPIESWIDAATQKRTPELKGFFEGLKPPTEADAAAAKKKYERDLAKWKEESKQAKADGKKTKAPQDPEAVRTRKGNVGGLFNGKIAPLIPYAIRGALWYQGEANSAGTKPPYYQHQLSLLVKDWRQRWGQGDFAFAWVQLPNFTRAGDGWMLVREGMLRTLAQPNTGMAITVDIGDPKDIHPKNKQEVGRRLSLWALGTTYGRKVVATSGPLPAGHEAAGNEIKLSFKHTNGGLVAKDGELKGFVVAGEDKQWKPAKATINGDKVFVSSPDVKQPVAARYAWQDNPEGNLYNGAGLPASPFRTDDWK
jgi:sialate O-acetylesterase